MNIASIGHNKFHSEPENQDNSELLKACQDFEAILLQKMLTEMRKAVPKSDLFGSRTEEEAWQDMIDAELSTSITQTRSLGLAELLYTQLSGWQKKR